MENEKNNKNENMFLNVKNCATEYKSFVDFKKIFIQNTDKMVSIVLNDYDKYKNNSKNSVNDIIDNLMCNSILLLDYLVQSMLARSCSFSLCGTTFIFDDAIEKLLSPMAIKNNNKLITIDYEKINKVQFENYNKKIYEMSQAQKEN